MQPVPTEINHTLENTIPNALSRAARKWPDRIGLVDFDRNLRVTYRQMNERANRLANALRDIGVRQGDKVAFILLNSHAIYECFFGISRIGGINVPVNYRFSPEELLYVIENSDSEVMIVEGKLMPAIEKIRERMTRIRKVIVFEPLNETLAGDVEYEAFLAAGEPTDPGVPVRAHNVANIMYTSGTTGHPKGCVLTHGAYTGMAMVCALELGAFGWSRKDRYLNITPSFHGGSWTFCLMSVMGGQLLVTLSTFEPEKVYRAIEAEKVTFTWMAAPMYAAMVASPSRTKYSLGSLRVMASAAAPLTTALRQRVNECFPNVVLVDWLGQTEQSCLVLGLSDPADIARKTACIGLPVSLVEADVVDDQGRPVSRGQIGELVTRSPFLMLGYYKNPEATADALRDGWFFTGDMALQDDEGYFYLVDRKKDIIITGGENVPSVTVEQVLYQLPEVLEAAVIGTPDEQWGECVTAVIALKAGYALTEAHVTRHCRDNLTPYMIPRRIIFIPELPKSTVGKIHKRSLRATYSRANLYGEEEFAESSL